MEYSFLGLVLSITIVYNSAVIVYNLFAHPLARFPGPRLAAASHWYEFWYDVFTRGRYPWAIQRMHDKYGPIVRVTPHEVHIQDAEWAILFLAGSGRIREKDPGLASIVGSSLGTFGKMSHTLHKHRRAPVAAYYSKRNVAVSLQKTMRATTEELCAIISRAGESAGQIIEGRALFLASAADTLTACSFGEKFGFLEHKIKAVQFIEVMKAFGILFPILKQCPWIIPRALRLPIAPLRAIFPPLAMLLEVHVEMGRFAEKVCLEEKQYADESEIPPTTVFRTILDSSLPEQEKEPHRLSHEGLELLLGGSYSTSRVLNIATYHVIANPKLNDALLSELKGVIPDPHAHVDLAVLQNLPLLSAIIKESLRIGNLSIHRLALVATSETLCYKQWTIPPGTCVCITPSPYGLDSSIFSEPQVFDPYRWIESDPSALRMMNRAFFPFAVGSRGCLGMHFTYAQLYIVISSIFRRFKLELLDTIKERDIDGSWAHMLSEPTHGSKGLRFKVTGHVER